MTGYEQIKKWIEQLTPTQEWVVVCNPQVRVQVQCAIEEFHMEDTVSVQENDLCPATALYVLNPSFIGPQPERR